MRYTEIIIDITILIPLNSDKYIYKEKNHCFENSDTITHKQQSDNYS